ncbi:hypothetical protein [Novosphingobium bradum]
MCGSRWISLAAESALLACDGAAVIGLRLARLARLDGAALAEARLMVEEKVESAADLHWRALTGALGTSPHAVASASLAFYRGKVAANRRRLSRD